MVIVSPHFVSGHAKRADVAAMRTSQLTASSSPPPSTRAGDRGDDGRGRIPQLGRELLERCDLRAERVGVEPLRDPQVLAGRERPRAAGEHDPAHLGVADRVAQRGAQRLQHRRVERVEDLGPVQHDGADRPGLLLLDRGHARGR